MFNSSIILLPKKRFNEYKKKINITHINFIKLLIETRRIKWKKRRWLTRFKTSKTNGEEVDEGCGGGAKNQAGRRGQSRLSQPLMLAAGEVCSLAAGDSTWEG